MDDQNDMFVLIAEEKPWKPGKYEKFIVNASAVRSFDYHEYSANPMAYKSQHFKRKVDGKVTKCWIIAASGW